MAEKSRIGFGWLPARTATPAPLRGVAMRGSALQTPSAGSRYSSVLRQFHASQPPTAITRPFQSQQRTWYLPATTLPPARVTNIDATSLWGGPPTGVQWCHRLPAVQFRVEPFAFTDAHLSVPAADAVHDTVRASTTCNRDRPLSRFSVLSSSQMTLPANRAKL